MGPEFGEIEENPQEWNTVLKNGTGFHRNEWKKKLFIYL